MPSFRAIVLLLKFFSFNIFILLVIAGCGTNPPTTITKTIISSPAVSASLLQDMNTGGSIIVNSYKNPVLFITSNQSYDYNYITASYSVKGSFWGTQTSPTVTPIAFSQAAQGSIATDPLTALGTIHKLENSLLQAAPLPSNLPISPLGNATPDTVGTTNTFWVLAGNNFVQVSATCQAVGVNCYVYVDNASIAAFPQGSPALNNLVATWDNQIYTNVRTNFGTEWKPGIDNDNRITLLISPAVHNYAANNGVLGFFWSGDEMTPAQLTGLGLQTNQREMMYVTDEIATAPPVMIYAILAHEFQHMIHFYNKYITQRLIEDTWLNEGLSMLTMQLAGFGMPNGDPTTTGWVNFFEKNPSFYLAGGQPYPNSVVLWNGAGYGQDYLFVLYLYEHYGGQALIQKLMTNQYIGIKSVEMATGQPFSVIYDKWLAAVYLDGLTANPDYNFTSIDLRGTYTSRLANGSFGPLALPGLQPADIATVPTNYAGKVLPPWTAEFMRFTGGDGSKVLDISLTGISPGLNAEIVNMNYQ